MVYPSTHYLLRETKRNSAAPMCFRLTFNTFRTRLSRRGASVISRSTIQDRSTLHMEGCLCLIWH